MRPAVVTEQEITWDQVQRFGPALADDIEGMFRRGHQATATNIHFANPPRDFKHRFHPPRVACYFGKPMENDGARVLRLG